MVILATSGNISANGVQAKSPRQVQHRYKYYQLGTFSGAAIESAAYSINNAGQIVGISSASPPKPNHAFLWQNGQFTDLGAFADGALSSAFDINSNGEIAGYSHVSASSSTTHAFLWKTA
ncbi:MAG: hypothetical protein HC853_12920 [Anaerolineae bacterium]|nr:hypothetical protein [Anaerolineae bacterium]